MKIAQNTDLAGKIVIVRVDLNVPTANGIVQDTLRLERITPTVKHLMGLGAKVVLISHFGRPKSRDMQYSLSQVIEPLNTVLQCKVNFATDCIGRRVRDTLQKTDFGGVIVLENLRFHPGEVTNDAAFAEDLASVADVYINDAFSCSHRSHASIVAITEFLPSFAGLALQREIDALEHFFASTEKISMAIIGGAKVSTKIGTLKCLVKNAEKIVIGGAMANTFLLASHHKIGNSFAEKSSEVLATCEEITKAASKFGCRIILPDDFIVASDMRAYRGEIKVIADITPYDMILDIGVSTIAKIGEEIANSQTILWNGPMGAFEHRAFSHGTFSIAKILAESTMQGTVKSIVGGGDTISAIRAAARQYDEFSFVSTGGGAFLDWLSAKNELPGLRALNGKIPL